MARTSRIQRTVVVASLILLTTGCGYSIRPPYNPGIKTVYVPVFKSISFQRDINLRLTELVIKEIQNRTPYKVVGTPEGADAMLEGTINFVDRNLVVENPQNLPRQLQQQINILVRFVDNRTGEAIKKEIPPVLVAELAYFFPELGETSELGAYKTMQKIAEQIVGMMEQPWEGTGLADDTVQADTPK